MPNRGPIHTRFIAEELPDARYWRRSEEQLLRERYTELGPKRIAPLLPGRSITAIRMRASRLRIATPRNRESA